MPKPLDESNHQNTSEPSMIEFLKTPQVVSTSGNIFKEDDDPDTLTHRGLAVQLLQRYRSVAQVQGLAAPPGHPAPLRPHRVHRAVAAALRAGGSIPGARMTVRERIYATTHRQGFFSMCSHCTNLYSTSRGRRSRRALAWTGRSSRRLRRSLRQPAALARHTGRIATPGRCISSRRL